MRLQQLYNNALSQVRSLFVAIHLFEASKQEKINQILCKLAEETPEHPNFLQFAFQELVTVDENYQ